MTESDNVVQRMIADEPKIEIQKTVCPREQFLAAIATDAAGIIGSDINSSDWYADGDDS